MNRWEGKQFCPAESKCSGLCRQFRWLDRKPCRRLTGDTSVAGFLFRMLRQDVTLLDRIDRICHSANVQIKLSFQLAKQHIESRVVAFDSIQSFAELRAGRTGGVRIQFDTRARKRFSVKRHGGQGQVQEGKPIVDSRHCFWASPKEQVPNTRIA